MMGAWAVLQIERLLEVHSGLGVVVPESDALAEKHELAIGWAEYADATLALQCDHDQREQALHSALDQVRACSQVYRLMSSVVSTLETSYVTYAVEVQHCHNLSV